MERPKKRLSAPLRLNWDIAPERLGGLASARFVEVAQEVASLRVFFVKLRPIGALPEGFDDVVRALKSGGSRVTVSAGAPELLPSPEIQNMADSLDLSPEAARSFPPLLEAALSLLSPSRISVTLVPERGNAAKVAEVFRLALDKGVTRLALANPNIITNRDAGRFILDEAARAGFKEALEPLLTPFGANVSFSVHDLFLHGALSLPGLGGLVEYAGCQAGDALCYIAPDGSLYPCASMDERVGGLSTSSFRELWSAASLTELRAGIACVPAGCEACPKARVCIGGCRGLAFATGGDAAKDPNCPAR